MLFRDGLGEGEDGVAPLGQWGLLTLFVELQLGYLVFGGSVMLLR